MATDQVCTVQIKYRAYSGKLVFLKTHIKEINTQIMMKYQYFAHYQEIEYSGIFYKNQLGDFVFQYLLCSSEIMHGSSTAEAVI